MKFLITEPSERDCLRVFTKRIDPHHNDACRAMIMLGYQRGRLFTEINTFMTSIFTIANMNA